MILKGFGGVWATACLSLGQRLSCATDRAGKRLTNPSRMVSVECSEARVFTPQRYLQDSWRRPLRPPPSAPAHRSISLRMAGIFICEQAGAVRVIKNGVLLAMPFTTFSVD